MSFRSLIVPCLLLLGGALPGEAQGSGVGDLLVSPTRVVFEGRKRTAELSLSNIGQGRATYRISLAGMEMDEGGAFREVPLPPSGPGQVNPQTLIRFSPREVTLGAQETQTVRLQVRKPAELPDGEYRIHMVFRAVPPAPEPQAQDKAGAKGLSIRLTPVFGIAIPLIVRHGQTRATVKLADLTLDPARKQFGFRVLREGNQSVYGDFQAFHLPPGGKAVPLAEAAGVAVYTPNASRKVTLPLSEVPPAGGRIRLTYTLPSAEGGALLAEAFLDLP
jgi:P pilus assembly chaperone PapD